MLLVYTHCLGYAVEGLASFLLVLFRKLLLLFHLYQPLSSHRVVGFCYLTYTLQFRCLLVSVFSEYGHKFSPSRYYYLPTLRSTMISCFLATMVDSAILIASSPSCASGHLHTDYCHPTDQ